MITRRNTELLLLLAAVPVLFLLFLSELVNSDIALSFTSFAVPLGLAAGFAAAHITVRKCAPNADPAILPITFLLSGIGICFVMRLAPELAVRQIAWLFLSIAAMILLLIFVKSVKHLARYKYTLMLVGIILLLLPAAFGMEQNGSRLWLSIGGFSFQPGELAKIFVVLFLAAYLADNREMLSITRKRAFGLSTPDLKTLVPLILMWLISLLIVVFERDLGSALFFFSVFLVMVFVATGRKFYVIIGFVLLAAGGITAYFVLGYVQARVDIWIDPFAYAQNDGYQLVQSFYSMADGGLFGTGVGRGMPTLIPVVESDFIFAGIAEEMGLLGASGVLILYVLFAVRGFAVAARSKNDVDALAAVGLTSAVTLQAFVIVGGVIGVIPLTGITLPFMSQGGSSLLSSFIIVALLLRAGDEGTGLETEIQGVTTLEGGILGRAALGKRLTVVITVFALLFAILIARLTYVMVIEAEDIQSMPTNNHTIARESQSERGAILTTDGLVLAESVENADGTYTRNYPETSLAAHAIGYTSETYGATGIEGSAADALSGKSDFSTWGDAIRSLAGADVPGNDVVLTIDSTIQRACEDALAGESGAAVVMDATTGAVLGIASSPTYDVNNVEDILDASQEGGGGSALVNRATMSLYAPGSTFKVVTLTSALDAGAADLSTTYNGDSPLSIGGGQVTNYADTSYGTITLQDALANSVNTVFAQVAVKLGSATLVETAEGFGFNRELGRDFDVVTSLMPDPDEMTEWETAWAADGQPVGEHASPAGPQATVVQMALVGASIANGGIAMNPYLIEKVLAPSGAVVSTNTPEKFSVVDTASTNTKVLEAMEAVITEGTAGEAAIPGVRIVGKTGTAQTGKAQDDSWFMGMTMENNCKIVVALVIEQTGGGAATPKAHDIFATALQVYGAL